MIAIKNNVRERWMRVYMCIYRSRKPGQGGGEGSKVRGAPTEGPKGGQAEAGGLGPQQPPFGLRPPL